MRLSGECINPENLAIGNRNRGKNHNDPLVRNVSCALVQIRSGRVTDIFTLRSPGDFVIWENNRGHQSEALTKATVIIVRWPSLVKNGKRSLG